jgi:hypothetical protein
MPKLQTSGSHLHFSPCAVNPVSLILILANDDRVSEIKGDVYIPVHGGPNMSKLGLWKVHQSLAKASHILYALWTTILGTNCWMDQGGPPAGRFYKLYNNYELDSAYFQVSQNEEKFAFCVPIWMFPFVRPSLKIGSSVYRRTAWGVQRGRRWPQVARPAGRPPLKRGFKR